MNLNMPSIFIKMKRGSCPYCGGTVRVLESEISETVLNSNGYPKAQESLSYNCVGYCCSCNNPVYIGTHSGDFRISSTSKIQDIFTIIIVS